MTNEYIELVKKWQAGEEVSQTELEDNAEAAEAAWDAAKADAYCWAEAAITAAVASHTAARAAARAAALTAKAAKEAADADHWIKRYEELTNA